MTLLDIADPLLQYICRLNRSVRKGVTLETNRVRSDVEGLLDDMRRAAQGSDMLEQFERVRLPLIYFVDFMIKESGGDIAREWRELAHEENMFAGDEHFFDLLDETLREGGKGASERLAVFYACLGLGFTGFYTGQPEYLRKKMLEISARIRGMVETDDAARICPEAYEHVNTTDLIQPPGRSLTGIVVALLALIIVLGAGNAYLYLHSSKELRAALDRISELGVGTVAGTED